MSHDHCDCVEGLYANIVWLRERLAEQDARGLRLAGEIERQATDLGRAMDDLLRVGARLRRIEEAARRCMDWWHAVPKPDHEYQQGCPGCLLRNALADQPTEEVTPQTGT